MVRRDNCGISFQKNEAEREAGHRTARGKKSRQKGTMTSSLRRSGW